MRYLFHKKKEKKKEYKQVWEYIYNTHLTAELGSNSHGRAEARKPSHMPAFISNRSFVQNSQ